jgi:four helix bundle protein
MRIERFEDIIAWKKAEQLTLLIYSIFSKCKDFGFRDQIQRASISIMNNIAEGFERKTNNDLKHFLFISKGSCGEVRSMLYIAKNQNYIDKEQFSTIYTLCIEISKILSGFIKTL